MNPFYEEVLNRKKELESDIMEVVQEKKKLCQKLCEYQCEPVIMGDESVEISLGKGEEGILIISGPDPGVILGAAHILKQKEEILPGRVDILFPGKDNFEGVEFEDDAYSAAMIVDSKKGTGEFWGFQVFWDDFPKKVILDYELTASAPKGLRGVNPVTITARINQGIQELIALEYVGQGVSVVHTEWKGGSAPNAFAEDSQLKGRLFAPTEQICEDVKERIEKLGTEITQAFRAQYSSSWERIDTDNKKENFGLTAQLAGYLGDAVGWEHMERIWCRGNEKTQWEIPTSYFRYVLETEKTSAVSLAAGAAACANSALHYLKSRIKKGGNKE